MPKVKVEKKHGSADRRNRSVPVEHTHLRTNRTTNRVHMYKSKIKRDDKGKIIAGGVLQDADKIEPGKMARVAPDRLWFGNTKVIGPKVLEKFREELGAKFHDPYSVVIRPAKLPLSLLDVKDHTEGLVKSSLDWTGTYGPKKTRKKPKLGLLGYDQLAEKATKKSEDYSEEKDKQTNQNKEIVAMAPKDKLDSCVFSKGQSSRIWGELYKVIDSSDVVIQVLDARDPMGTRSRSLEYYMRKEKKYKHLVFVMNKCDLIPTWATSRWVALLSREYPTIPFHASITNPFGKGNLINLIRQFGRLHASNNNDMLSVGLVGYPNVGKSSIINTLRRKKTVNVSSIPGETKVWQYVRLSRKISMIDCPGVIHNHDEANDNTQAVLKGVVRVEKLDTEEKIDFIETVLKLVSREKLEDTYDIKGWTNHIEFLDLLANRRNRILRGGRLDRDGVARNVLYDWQRAKIPWFMPPPFESDADEAVHRKMPKASHLKLITEVTEQMVYDQEEQGKTKKKKGKKGAAKRGRADGDDEGAEVVDDDEDGAEEPEEPKPKKMKVAAIPRGDVDHPGVAKPKIRWSDLKDA